jgi:hypothetical protein
MFKKPFSSILIGILILFVLVSLLPIAVTKLSWISLDVDHPNEIGDTIGGILGPLVGFIGILVTFLAFWMQYKANEKQFQKFDDQEIDTKVERFENKFYELLKLHRENVNEFEIVRNDGKGTLRGRRIFVEMFEELKLAHLAVRVSNQKLIRDKRIQFDYFSESDIYKVAYIVFFNGFFRKPILTEKANELWQFQILSEKYNQLLNETFDALSQIKYQMDNKALSVITLYSDDLIVIVTKPKISYKLFKGHHSRLGHYFRGLFQLVSFVVDADEKIIKEKYSYIKTIRAQLSNHEQLLLYYNALSVYGTPWLKNKYLNDWKMISNIPIGLADLYINPKEQFGERNSKGDLIFEIDEISERD